MATDHIRYDLLVQDAFRDLFRKVLMDVAAHGLPGEHHFFITFKTTARGVNLSDGLRQQYPERMTISLRHQFWDLAVNETSFEVGLSFKQIPEKLTIPFAAVTGFFDPSVNFGAEFTVDDDAAEDSEPAKGKKPPILTAVPSTPVESKQPAPLPMQASPPILENAAVYPASSDNGAPKESDSDDDAPAPDQAAEKSDDGDATKVVSIDAFRKKKPS